MEKIDLEDVDDAIRREKLFVRAATNLLQTLEFKRVEEGYDGELMRPAKEIEDAEKDRQRKAEKMARRHSEIRMRRSKARELDSDELETEGVTAPVLSNRETLRKNKSKHPVNTSLKRRRMKSRQKRHRH